MLIDHFRAGRERHIQNGGDAFLVVCLTSLGSVGSESGDQEIKLREASPITVHRGELLLRQGTFVRISKASNSEECAIYLNDQPSFPNPVTSCESEECDMALFDRSRDMRLTPINRGA